MSPWAWSRVLGGGYTGTRLGVELVGLCDGLDMEAKEMKKSRMTPSLGRPGLVLSLQWML